MIIQRRADQLQPGDILPKNSVAPRRVVLTVTPGSTISGSFVGVTTAPHPPMGHAAPHMPESFNSLQTVDVEVPYQGAMLHAEALLDLARRVANLVPPYGNIAAEAQALIDKIEPKPPTLDEALRALAELEEGARAVQVGEWDKDSMQDQRNAAREILDRARATGVI